MLETLKGLGIGVMLLAVGWISHKYGMDIQEAGKSLLRGKRVELGNFDVAVVRLVTVAFLAVGSVMCIVGLPVLAVEAVRAVL